MSNKTEVDAFLLHQNWMKDFDWILGSLRVLCETEDCIPGMSYEMQPEANYRSSIMIDVDCEMERELFNERRNMAHRILREMNQDLANRIVILRK